MNKVLLTGATGLIGKEAISPLIEAGFSVHAVSSKLNAAENINWIQADLLVHDDIERIFSAIRPDYLLHFAWIASGGYLESEENFMWLDSGIKMLETFYHFGGKRAVYTGTCFEYDFKYSPLKENNELRPKTAYAKCKSQLEVKARQLAGAKNLPFGWGRVFYVYGHGEDPRRLTPHIINSLKNDQEVIIHGGTLIRDYMYSKDIAAGFVKLLQTNLNGSVNICSGKGITIKEYALNIARQMDKVHLIRFADSSDNQPPRIVGDNSLLKRLGFTQKFSIEMGINKVIEMALKS